jgi:hypothetical protein
MADLQLATSSACAFTSVGDSATSVSLLAANLQRQGGSIVNTSSAILYVRMDGGTATATTGYNVSLDQGDYFEIPAGYTGAISGIWASDAGGAANIAEYS